VVDPRLLDLAGHTKGFLPTAEALALREVAIRAGALGPLLEIGSYCGLSAIYLGDAARAASTLLFSVDHHRGSEEHQPGQDYHDPALAGADGRVDTLPAFRDTVAKAGLEHWVVAVVGESARVAAAWRTPLGLLFVDGGHSQAAADADYAGWAPWVVAGGVLAIHDVFPDPRDGGRPPFVIYERARRDGFEEFGATGSLRLLTRPARGRSPALLSHRPPEP